MRVNREKAVPAHDAEAAVLREFDESTQRRVERIRQFADAIRTAIRNRRRHTCDLTQAHLAERLGVSVSTVSRLESGRGMSGMDFEVAIAAIAELGAEPMLTLLDPEAPGACEVIDMTLTEQEAVRPRPARAATLNDANEASAEAGPSAETGPLRLGSRHASFSDPAVAVGFQSELEAMREQMSRLTDAVQHLSQANHRQSSG